MNKNLFIQALLKFMLGFLLVSLLLFLPAGTLHYPQAWILLAVLFIPMFLVGLILFFTNPDLLRSRLRENETERTQEIVIILSAIMFLAIFITASLSFHYQWLQFPVWVNHLGLIIFIFSYALYGEVLRENQYLSRSIEVQEHQVVVDTGLYAIVRHPMYTSTIFLFLSIPLILGSAISFCISLFYIPIFVMRIKNEEKVLSECLDGYKEYTASVKYRLFPWIW